MKKAVIAVIITIFLLAACDNDNTGNTNKGTLSIPTDFEPIPIAYSASGTADISDLLGWEWAKDNTDFVWTFEKDGTVTVLHCCGDKQQRQFNYLLRGNVLITYGSEESFDEIEAGTFTMASDSLKRYNGSSFTQGDAIGSAASSLSLSNKLLGKWQSEDGTEYEFSSDAGLKIISTSGVSEEYGYLTRNASVFLALGPLVDGEEAVLQKYLYNLKGGKLYLNLDGVLSTLTSIE
jgi:hypothetical protein